MKKTFGIIIGALAGTAVIGSGVYYSDADVKSPKLNSDEIRQMVEDQYDGTITELELDKDRNQAVYEVEVIEKSKEHDLKLDADTGEVLREKSKDINKDDDDIEDDVKLDMNNEDLIGVEKAKEIAKNNFDGKVVSIELDDDDNRLIYELELKNGKKEADFDIDAKNGEILEMDVEADDDDE
ncbi:PepSY domain-containing protein [Virgibacillus salexigens]|uniref:PepSY domain-containing protein n=1 Tax=Virgibacillus TaxID=84406 RepID=UPI00136834D4|nr:MULTISPECIES: PepSY domain-containing protein [Virgibacillus]MYL43844.1 hypothetical protein [Virgibacillus massiliensis]